ncbi:MAG TPA: tRNA (guanosine(46)-N7)-methyltransferase TrmB [Candidatus Competibacteraceae bacterium]|nr:tRNA (guanosine(46)-N7)-methyltransferase TrmB [Candidatus Competibacteraceae bacterium]
MSEHNIHHHSRHPIRSFVLRQGRLTPGQQYALDNLWERYGVDPPVGVLDLDALFGRRAPRILEIGFGNGESLAAMAMAQPELDYLGIEVHRPGVGHLLLLARQQGLQNLRIMAIDAVEVIERQLPDACLDRIQIFFPDPWPKQRHHKRRLIQPAFIEQITHKLKPGACLHLATDWEDYAHHMLAVLYAAEGLVNTVTEGGFAARPGYRPVTKFERRGERLGHPVRDLIFRKSCLPSGARE